MRRLLPVVLVVLVAVGLVACQPNPVPQADLVKWQARLEVVTPVSSPPPIVRLVINTAIRAGVPIICPTLAAQAAPAFQGFITGTCTAIVKSNDPFTTTVSLLPALCAGNPPVGALAFPNLATAITATCPLLVTLVPLLGLANYLPGMGASPPGAGAPA